MVGGKDQDDPGMTVGYKDYVRLFLLFVNGDTLAERTSNLIGLNLTNYKEKINADEEAMAQANRVNMSKAVTGFSITTTLEMRMLFLSMPIARRGVNGVVPPGTFQITATDYRGY